jgi:general secretion pathway protein K
MNRPKDVCRSQRGVALIVTLVIITILVTLLVELTYSTQVNVRLASTFKDDVQAHYIAKSGIDLAMAALEKDFQEDQQDTTQGKQTGPNDNLNELWAKLPDAIAAVEALQPDMFGDGRLIVQIIDEDRKINANLVKQEPIASIMNRLFARAEISQEFKSCLTDWIDEDQEETQPGGAEGSYYEGLDIPYPCKDKPMDSISELAMIKGGKEALEKTLPCFEGEGKKNGKWTLKDLLSVVPGQGPNINVNTAPGPVIQALHDDIDPVHMNEFILDRASEPFPTVEAFRDYFKNTFGIAELPPNLTVRSEYFRIESTGIVGKAEKTITAVVHRNPGNGSIEIISWRIE